MKIDVHCHQIEKFFHETLAALPGVTVKINPDRFSYLVKDGNTWLPFRPEMFDPDHLIREMDRKGIDISILSMNTPSVYIFEGETRIALARRLNDSLVARAKRNPDRVRGFGTLPLPDVEAAGCCAPDGKLRAKSIVQRVIRVTLLFIEFFSALLLTSDL